MDVAQLVQEFKYIAVHSAALNTTQAGACAAKTIIMYQNSQGNAISPRCIY